MKKKDKEKPIDKDTELNESDLEKLCDELQKEKAEVFAQLQRVSADYANFQKRVPRQISDSISYEKERIIKSLLPVLDNFEHTLQNAEKAENIDVLAKGIKIIYDQMIDIFKSHGVEQLKTLGELFNPAMHEAMMRRNEIEKEDNTILEEFQKGYKLHDRVIRPSKVVVNKLQTEQKVTEEKESDNDKAVEDFEINDTE